MKRTRIGVMRIDNTISFGEKEEDVPGLIDPQFSRVIEKRCDGLLIRINSPGGTVASAQHVYLEILRLRKLGVRVVCLMEDVAASGGLYAALAGEKIYAYHGTLTGSIGTIMETTQYNELLKKVGLSKTTLKSGNFKDIGNPNREMTDEEKSLLECLLHESHQEFCATIANARNIPISQVVSFADGRILSGKKALELGLIDGVGGYRQALSSIKSLLGLDAEEDHVVITDLLSKKGLTARLFKGLKPFRHSLENSILLKHCLR